MEKLQYDSFYKFLVSLGIILITLPIVVLVFIYNSDAIILSQAEFDALSEYSRENLSQKELMINTLLKLLPWGSALLISLGIALIVFGSLKWHSIQLELDEQIKSDTITKRINAKKMSTPEIVIKAAKELADAEAEIQEENDEKAETPKRDASTEIKTAEPPSAAQKSEAPLSHHDMLVKYMEIEDKCFSLALKEYSKLYHLQKNVRVGTHEYDFIAVSKNDNIDLLFEVKYWKRTPAVGLVYQVISRADECGRDYENTAHRNFKSIILIVSPAESMEKVHAAVERVKSRQNTLTEIKYIFEEEL